MGTDEHEDPFDDVLCVLAMYNKHDDKYAYFDEQDEALLLAFARDAHRCLEIHFTRHKRERSSRNAALVYPACAEVASTSDLPALRGAITRAVQSIMPCDLRKTLWQRQVDLVPPDRVSIFLLQKSKDGLVDELQPLLGPEGTPDGYPRGESVWVANHVQKTQKPLLVYDTRMDKDIQKPAPEVNWFKMAQNDLISSGVMPHSIVAAPITDGEGKFLGVVQALTTVEEGHSFQPGLRMPDLSNLIKL